MMQMMQKEPKPMGRMMELQDEMMRMMSDAMIQRGKRSRSSASNWSTTWKRSCPGRHGTWSLHRAEN